MEVASLLEVLVSGVQICPDDLSNIAFLSAVDVSHTPQSVCENDEAEWNIKPMSVALDTSHLERSLLNDDAE